MTNKAFFKQIGGKHYKVMKIQPSVFINENGLPFAEGNAIKYRWLYFHYFIMFATYLLKEC